MPEAFRNPASPWFAIVVCGVALALTGVRAASQDTFDPATAPLTAPLPLDPAVTTGTLPNGLRYYIRANARPAKRAELRLVVKAGSILEDDDQRGAAHLVEHMAFTGTAHFPGASLLAFLSRFGTNLGRDLNGSTSFHETIYKLQVPTDTPDALDGGLSVLNDWSRAIQFEPAVFERERAIVIEEWRMRQGAFSRLMSAEYNVVLAGSRYADRAATGTEASLRSLTLERVKQFYDDWYRPDQMSVVTVGDFDPAVVERLIRGRFTGSRATSTPPARPGFRVPERADTTYDVITNPDPGPSVLAVLRILPARDRTTVGSVKASIADLLVSTMLGVRFSDLARSADPPFISVTGVTRGRLVSRLNDGVAIGAVVKETGFTRALDAVATETRRASTFGFTETEVEEQRTAVRRVMDRTLAERETRLSAIRADEYVNRFVEDQPVVDERAEAALTRRFLSSVTAADVDAVAKEWFGSGNRFVIAVAPGTANAGKPDIASLRATVAASDARTLTPTDRSAAPLALMTGLPVPGTIVSTSTITPPSATVWNLSNGARVVLVPTTVKTDEIHFFATAPGGRSLASDAELGAATASMLAARAGGLGGLTRAEVARALAGRAATVEPSLGDFSTRLRGAGSRQDLETLFQVIHLRFAPPTAAAAPFESGKTATKVVLASVAGTPDLQFADAVAQALSGNHPRVRVPTPAEIDAWTLDEALAFYRARFADAGNFTFGFIGSFDLDAMRPLVERYLASLPAATAHETWRDTGMRVPDGVVERIVHAGTDNKARVALVFTGPLPYDAKHKALFSALGSVVQSRLFATIRNSLGGTYTISAAPQIENVPQGSYKFKIQWECDPARVDELVQRVFTELASIKTNPVLPAGLLAYRNGVARNLTSANNATLAAMLLDAYENGDDAGGPWRAVDALGTLTAADIMDAARTYLDSSRYVKVVMLPVGRPGP